MVLKPANGVKFIALLVVVVATILRQPELLQQPRFFAEEGQSFFAFAYNHSLWEYLTSPMYGYYTLYNVIATSIATLPRLEIAPLVTAYLAMGVQIAASAMALWRDVPILDTDLKRFLAAVSFPLICPSQIWLTTIGVQYWLCVVSALILLERPAQRTRPVHLINGAILLLNGLTGVLSCLMIPAFFWKWKRLGSKQHLAYAGVLSASLTLQVAVFLRAYLKHDLGVDERLVAGNPAIDVIYHSTILFLSRFLLHGEVMDLPIYDYLDRGINYLVYLAAGRPLFPQDEAMYLLASVALAALLGAVLYRRRNDFDCLALAVSALIVFSVSVALSIRGIGGHRYMFAPACMLMLLMISSGVESVSGRLGKVAVVLIVALMFVSNVMDYRPSMSRVYNGSWPKWEEEVRSWRADRAHALNIWPPPWEMRLD